MLSAGGDHLPWVARVRAGLPRRLATAPLGYHAGTDPRKQSGGKKWRFPCAKAIPNSKVSHLRLQGFKNTPLTALLKLASLLLENNYKGTPFDIRSHFRIAFEPPILRRGCHFRGSHRSHVLQGACRIQLSCPESTTHAPMSQAPRVKTGSHTWVAW